MKILGLDPGLTTGYALLDEGGRLLESGNLELEDFGESILVDLSEDIGVQAVIEETTVDHKNPNFQALNKVILTLDSMFREAQYVRPGVWKGHLPIVNLPFPVEKFDKPTQHQKDAYRLAYYYLVHSNFSGGSYG